MLRKTLIRYGFNKNHIYLTIRKSSVAKPVENPLRMKAWQVHSYGEELQCCPIRYPLITLPTQVLIQVEAASINPIDIAMQNGYGRTFLNILRGENQTLPITLGRDFCGTIINKGHGVSSKYKIGDRVYGMIMFNRDGSHAEIVAADQSSVCHMPENVLSYIEASSIPYAAMTAWSALWIFGGLSIQKVARKKVLVLGASGGVGTFAIQMLKAKKATVYATCSPNAIPLVEKFKVDCVFDYTDKDYVENIQSQGRYDIILDCAKIGYDNIPSTWQFGSYITLNSPLISDTDKYGLVGGLASCASKIIPTNLGSLPQGKLIKWGYVIPCEQGIQFVNDLVQKCELLPTIDSVFSFDDTLKAYEKVKNGHLRGKVVLDMLSNCDNINKDNVEKK